MTANGGKPLMSQRESIERYGKSDDVDKTLKEIKEEEAENSTEEKEATEAKITVEGKVYIEKKVISAEGGKKTT